MKNYIKSVRRNTFGLDLGKKYSHVFGLSQNGEVVAEGRLPTSAERFREYFSKLKPAVVVIEAGPISLWVNVILGDCGHEVLVANPRKVALIYGNRKKTDRLDAENLARLGRLDRELLEPIKLRGFEAQEDLSILRTRELFVQQRTKLINHIRSRCASFGEQLPKCDAHYFHNKMADKIPINLKPALGPAIDQIVRLTKQISEFDKQIEKLCVEKYPETKNISKVKGVGSLTALAFVLTLHDPGRFKKSRQVGAFLGIAVMSKDICPC